MAHYLHGESRHESCKAAKEGGLQRNMWGQHVRGLRLIEKILMLSHEAAPSRNLRGPQSEPP